MAVSVYKNESEPNLYKFVEHGTGRVLYATMPPRIAKKVMRRINHLDKRRLAS